MDDGSALANVGKATDRAALRSMSQRRRRVWRNLIVFVLVTCAMILLSMAERDNQAVRGTIRQDREDLEYACAQLQEAFERGRLTPAKLPLPPIEPLAETASPAERELREDEELDRLLRYVYNRDHRRLAGPERAAIVCYNAEPHLLYLQANPRHVIVFDGERYETKTFDDKEFRRQAAELGAALPG